MGQGAVKEFREERIDFSLVEFLRLISQPLLRPTDVFAARLALPSTRARLERAE